MKHLLIFLVIIQFQSKPAQAQSIGDQPIVQRGELISLKVIPRSGKLEFYLVGNRGAVVEFDKAGLSASILIGKTRRDLTIRKQLGYFSLDKSSIPLEEANTLRIHAEIEGKTEVFDLEVKK